MVVRTTFCDLLSTSLQNRTTKSESCNGTNTKCKTLQNQKSMDHSFRYRNTLGAVFVLLFLFSIVHYLELFVFLLLSLIIFSSYLSKKKKDIVTHYLPFILKKLPNPATLINSSRENNFYQTLSSLVDT